MKASASITITSYTDGLTTFYQYAKNTSNTTPPTTGWSATMPASEPGKFIWRREASALSLEDVTAWGNAMCLTGPTGPQGPKGDTGASDQLIVQYALGTWDIPYTVIIGEESWCLGQDYWIAGQNFWQSTAKHPTSPDSYVWRRERIYHPSTDTYSDWSYTRLSGVQGEQGPMGNPGQLGLYAEGTTLHLKGFAEDGSLTAPTGIIYAEGQRYIVPAYSQTLTAEGKGYAIFDGVAAQFAKLIADGTSKRWEPYNGGEALTSDFFVLGSFMKNGDVIYDIQYVMPERSESFERSHFMDILASGDIQNINKWAQANGIDQVFQRVAMLEAFIDSLVANEAFIKNLVAQNMKAGPGTGLASSGFRFRAQTDSVGDGSDVAVFDIFKDDKQLFKVDVATGKIYFGEHFWYDPATGSIRTPNDKTVIKADGTIEAVDGRFSGDVFAESGYFKGIFDTTALKLEPGDTTAHNFTQASAMTQARNFFNALSSFGMNVDTFYKASTSVSSIQMYIKMSPWPDNRRTVDLSDLSYIRINNANGQGGIPVYQLQLFDSAKRLIPALSEFPFGSLLYHGSTYYTMTTTSFTITVYTGGDKLIVSPDIPDNPVGLADYQIYHSNGILCIKLP